MTRMILCFLVLATAVAARASEVEINQLLGQISERTYYRGQDEYIGYDRLNAPDRSFPPTAELLTDTLHEMMTLDSPVLRADPALLERWNHVIDLLIVYRDELKLSVRLQRTFEIDDAVEDFGRPAGAWGDDDVARFVRAVYADVQYALITRYEDQEEYAETKFWPDRRDLRARYRERATAVRALPLVTGAGSPLFFEIKTLVEKLAQIRATEAVQLGSKELLLTINHWRKQVASPRTYCAELLTAAPSA